MSTVYHKGEGFVLNEAALELARPTDNELRELRLQSIEGLSYCVGCGAAGRRDESGALRVQYAGILHECMPARL